MSTLFLNLKYCNYYYWAGRDHNTKKIYFQLFLLIISLIQLETASYIKESEYFAWELYDFSTVVSLLQLLDCHYLRYIHRKIPKLCENGESHIVGFMGPIKIQNKLFLGDNFEN